MLNGESISITFPMNADRYKWPDLFKWDKKQIYLVIGIRKNRASDFAFPTIMAVQSL